MLNFLQRLDSNFVMAFQQPVWQTTPTKDSLFPRHLSWLRMGAGLLQPPYLILWADKAA